jgi:hypothetical protein
MLALVLLFLVPYGAISDTAHRHDRLVPEATHSGINAVSGPANSDSPLSNSPSKGECLICQLHQHLFAGLTNALPQTHDLQFDSAHHAAAAFFFYSLPNTPGHGRAPPIFLL